MTLIHCAQKVLPIIAAGCRRVIAMCIHPFPVQAILILAGLILLCPASPGVCATDGEEIDCGRYLSGSAASVLTRQEIVDLQKKLRDNGYPHGKDDGVFGPETLKALKRYCDDLRRRNAQVPTHAVSYQLTGQDVASLVKTKKLYAALKGVKPTADRNALVQLLEASLKAADDDQKTQPVAIIEEKVSDDGKKGQDAGKAVQADGDTQATMWGVKSGYLNRLKKQVVPDQVIAVLQAVQDVDFPVLDLFDNAVEEQFKIQSLEARLYSGELKHRLQRMAQTPHPMDDLGPLQWKNDRCGCVPEFTGTANTYGFYPYWLKGKGEEGVPQIDFSALSRIGCFALYLDRDGRLQAHELWESRPRQAGFVSKAHKYRTRADVVVHIPDWFAWYEIVTAHQGRVVRELAGLVSTAPKADGITLFLGTYPENPSHLEAFKQLLGKLRARLDKTGRPFALNLMLPAILKQNEEKVGRFLTTIFPETAEALDADDRESAPDMVDLLLVFLYQPTTYWKKEMRYIIEKHFKGVQRKKVQRKILPVVMSPADAGDQQFIDDLIYFEDNFGGVGFWPVPDGAEKNRRRLSEEVSAAFVNPDQAALMQKVWVDQFQQICRFICPNRGVLRIIFLSGFAFMALWAVIACWVCELRRIYRRFSWYFLAVILIDILLLFSLLICDPAWVGYSTAIFIGMLIALAFYLVFRQVGKMKAADYP
jgi:hypothetical protein